jgi:plastocyanin
VKILSYCFMTIASAILVILLSLSACTPQTNTISQISNPTPNPTPSPTPSQMPSPQKVADFTVKIRNFKYEPSTLTIAAGKTVQFINLDEEPHTATATDGSFDSKALDTDQTWNYTATKPGEAPYYCSVHPFMKAMLTVTPENKK